MKEHKLKSGMYWQEELKRKGVKQVGRKISAACS
jgi:hypothetical protein